MRADLELAKWLVETGADLIAKDAQGRTALMVAEEIGGNKLTTFLKSEAERVR